MRILRKTLKMNPRRKPKTMSKWKSKKSSKAQVMRLDHYKKSSKKVGKEMTKRLHWHRSKRWRLSKSLSAMEARLTWSRLPRQKWRSSLTMLKRRNKRRCPQSRQMTSKSKTARNQDK